MKNYTLQQFFSPNAKNAFTLYLLISTLLSVRLSVLLRFNLFIQDSQHLVALQSIVGLINLLLAITLTLWLVYLYDYFYGFIELAKNNKQFVSLLALFALYVLMSVYTSDFIYCSDGTTAPVNNDTAGVAATVGQPERVVTTVGQPDRVAATVGQPERVATTVSHTFTPTQIMNGVVIATAPVTASVVSVGVTLLVDSFGGQIDATLAEAGIQGFTVSIQRLDPNNPPSPTGTIFDPSQSLSLLLMMPCINNLSVSSTPSTNNRGTEGFLEKIYFLLNIHPETPTVPVAALAKTYGSLHQSMLGLVACMCIILVFMCVSIVYGFNANRINQALQNTVLGSSRLVVAVLSFLSIRNKVLLAFFFLLMFYCIVYLIICLKFMISNPIYAYFMV